ncbi:hypothetical protein P3S67_004133 [Capsicum chacoense]
MAKYSLRFPIEKDQKMMNNLVKYVMGKPFPDRHTVMEDVDECYGMRGFTPSEIFESAKGPRELYFITFQDLKKAKRFTRQVGTWWPEKRVKPIYDADKRHMGNIKISWYYYRGDKEPSECHMREYYLSSKCVPQNKVERNHVVVTLVTKTMKITRAADEEMMDTTQSNEQQIMQSLQLLQLQDSPILTKP